MRYLIIFIIFSQSLYSQAYRETYIKELIINSSVESSTQTVSIHSSSGLTESITFTMPDEVGVLNELLTSNGSGTLFWSTPSSTVSFVAGSTGNIQYNESGTFAASDSLWLDISNKRLGINIDTPEKELHLIGNLRAGSDGSDGSIVIYKNGTTDYQVTFAPNAAMTASTSITLPGTDGDNNSVLASDGGGNLFWVTEGSVNDCPTCDCDEGQGTGGGIDNTATGDESFIGGGSSNTVGTDNTDGFIGSGTNNVIEGNDSGIYTGENNDIDSDASESTIGTGVGNLMLADQSTIVSGTNNFQGVNADYSFIGTGNQNAIFSDYCVIGSGNSNTINTGSNYGIIGNGMLNYINNDEACAIFVGTNNTIENGADNNVESGAVIFGGSGNSIEAFASLIANGKDNTIDNDSDYSTIINGENQLLTENYSIILGGRNNLIDGTFAMSFGDSAIVTENYAMAFGRNAVANDGGAWVFTDSNNDEFESDATDRFHARFENGYIFYTNAAQTTFVSLAAGGNSWASSSDSNLKENILSQNPSYFYNNIDLMPVSSWNYKSSDDKTIRHYGPMAQDFFSLFGKDSLGTIGSDIKLSPYQLSSVGLLALKGHQEEYSRIKNELEKVKKESEELDEEIELLYHKLLELEAENE